MNTPLKNKANLFLTSALVTLVTACSSTPKTQSSIESTNASYRKIASNTYNNAGVKCKILDDDSSTERATLILEPSAKENVCVNVDWALLHSIKRTLTHQSQLWNSECRFGRKKKVKQCLENELNSNEERAEKAKTIASQHASVCIKPNGTDKFPDVWVAVEKREVGSYIRVIPQRFTTDYYSTPGQGKVRVSLTVNKDKDPAYTEIDYPTKESTKALELPDNRIEEVDLSIQCSN